MTLYTFNELRKNIKKDYSAFRKVSVAILSDSASQFLATALKGYGYVCGIWFDIYEADYNQIDLQVFDPSSELYEFNPDYIIINRSSEKLLKEYCKRGKLDQETLNDDVADLTNQYLSTISGKLKSRIIINTYPELNDSQVNHIIETINKFK
jgi:predicted enzyme involved in methoxymalonyl-ACP biosynthesis